MNYRLKCKLALEELNWFRTQKSKNTFQEITYYHKFNDFCRCNFRYGYEGEVVKYVSRLLQIFEIISWCKPEFATKHTGEVTLNGNFFDEFDTYFDIIERIIEFDDKGSKATRVIICNYIIQLSTAILVDSTKEELLGVGLCTAYRRALALYKADKPSLSIIFDRDVDTSSSPDWLLDDYQARIWAYLIFDKLFPTGPLPFHHYLYPTGAWVERAEIVKSTIKRLKRYVK